MAKNYYQILGLEEGASEEEIRKAFRLYAQKFHPDKHDGDEFFKERFEEVKEAHDELLKRKMEEKHFDNNRNYSTAYYYREPRNENHTYEKTSNTPDSVKALTFFIGGGFSACAGAGFVAAMIPDSSSPIFNLIPLIIFGAIIALFIKIIKNM